MPQVGRVKVDPELRDLGVRLRALRLEAGLSQEDLADRSGLHRNYIGGIERGERNVGIKAILAICRALNRSPADVFA
ncbi:helix-turn-helix domain-containing protein [Brevundimonas sp. LM2]|uniref:helix-turn-helix domain-containing protein n=1 Tax=Brevundimonas sp. LM2 TaxID=1938605 RepID=UPI00209B7478|nr:helix-turn-helix transcriptional regulator [Brevundimonas sp. LM2]